MNVHTNSTGAAMPATFDWSAAIDGNNGVYDLASRLVHQLHFLVHDLEWSFDENRGSKIMPSGSISLMFQGDSLDAKKWLAGKIWLDAKDLLSQIERCQRALDDTDEAQS